MIFFIARRYFFAKSNHTAVNFISLIATVGLVFSTAAMIIILSVFEGLKDFTLQQLSMFNPHLEITTKEGKHFEIDATLFEVLDQTEGICAYTATLSEKAFLRYKSDEHFAIIKGVDRNYSTVNQTDTAIVSGSMFTYKKEGIPGAVIGRDISYKLSLGAGHNQSPLQIFVPRVGRYSLNTSTLYDQGFAFVSGIFNVTDYNDKYVLMPIDAVRSILSKDTSTVSSIEIKLESEEAAEQVKGELIATLGDDFVIKTRRDQQDFFYKLVNSERIVSYLMFVLIVCIALFTIIGAVVMLIIDKKSNIKTLWNLGLSAQKVRQIFLTQGLLIVLVSTIVGLGLGISFVVIQSSFGLIKVGGSVSFAYPVAFNIENVWIVGCTTLVLGYGACKLSVYQVSKKWIMNQRV